MENGLEFSDEATTVVVSVEEAPAGDRGPRHRPGQRISEDALERIFEPLEQAEELHTRTHPGVGLGLTVARMSARSMDGDVTLERRDRMGRCSSGGCRRVRSRRRPRDATAGPYLNRRMWTFSRIPTPRQLASIELPP